MDNISLGESLNMNWNRMSELIKILSFGGHLTELEYAELEYRMAILNYISSGKCSNEKIREIIIQSFEYSGHFKLRKKFNQLRQRVSKETV